MKLPRPYSVEEIANTVSGKVIGADYITICGINEIHKVVSGDLSFVDHPKYYSRCLNSQASAVMINAEISCPSDKALIVVADPILCYNKLVEFFNPGHPYKNLEHLQNRNIDETVVIAPGTYIGRNVDIGKNSVIHSNVCILDNATIGNNVVIHAGAIVGSDAYYYKRRDSGYDKLLSCGRVVVEDEVEIGPLCTIAKGVSGDTIIGYGSKLDAQVHIGHGVVIGKRCLIAAQVGIAGKTNIEDEVILWGQVGVSKDLTIGRGAIVLAQSGVSKSLPGGKTYFGSPAEEVRVAYRNIARMKLNSNRYKRKSS